MVNNPQPIFNAKHEIVCVDIVAWPVRQHEISRKAWESHSRNQACKQMIVKELMFKQEVVKSGLTPL